MYYYRIPFVDFCGTMGFSIEGIKEDVLRKHGAGDYLLEVYHRQVHSKRIEGINE